jgi:capsular polysaccharide export protein
MTLQAAQTVFAVPPFPGSSPFPVICAAEPHTAASTSGVTPGAMIAALRHHRVGGRFWAVPDLPAGPVRARADDSEALLAAIQGRVVTVEGDGRYASLSDLEAGSPPAEAALEMLVLDDLLKGISYQSPFTGDPISPLQLIEILGEWRALIDANRTIAAAFGFARWKQDTVEPLLWGGQAVPFRAARDSLLAGLDGAAGVAVWKARVPSSFLARLEATPRLLLEVEDGFIRSAGLGADCVPPLSIVVDDLGVHYDPARPNRLEEMLARGDFAPADLDRAARLRAWLVREGVSKYGVASATALVRQGKDRRHLLVVGQVEDDRSVQYGGGEVQSNLDLLQRVRALAPDAYIVYRPHPDVEAGHRRGAISQRAALELADAIDPSSAIGALIDLVDEVHVITSLAGFEALMRGKTVITHGTPFFAGWGLTTDLAPIPSRRGTHRTLDELVAATLLQYPRYLDPVTNLPCPAEVMILRLLTGNRRRNDALVPLRQFFGWMKRASQRFLGMQ